MSTTFPSIAAPPKTGIGAAIAAFLMRGVPEVSARTLAVFRIVFATLLLYFSGYVSQDALHRLKDNTPKYHANSFEFLKAIAQSDVAVALIDHGITVLLVCLLIGFLSRILFPVLVVLYWLAALLMNEGHSMTPLVLALTGALPARWSDAMSVDRLLGIAKPVPGRTRLYGYPIWLVGLAIALAYAAAGFSKLVLTNGKWLWETGVRWGFVADLNNAVVDWGLFFVNNYWMALLGSIFASFGQILYLYSCFTRNPLIKGAIGLFVAVPFLIGLILFMGLIWWAWLVLIVMLYVPWPQLARLWDSPATIAADVTPLRQFPGHHRWFILTTTFMLSGHAAAVGMQQEYEPLISHYPMYAVHFRSNTQYEKAEWLTYKKAQRHFVYDIEVIDGDKQTSYGVWYRVIAVTSNLGPLGKWLERSYPFSQLVPREIWDVVSRNEIIPAQRCGGLRYMLRALEHSDGAKVQYSRRYYDIVDGVVSWVPVEQFAVVDVGNQCKYTIRQASKTDQVDARHQGGVPQ